MGSLPFPIQFTCCFHRSLNSDTLSCIAYIWSSFHTSSFLTKYFLVQTWAIQKSHFCHLCFAVSLFSMYPVFIPIHEYRHSHQFIKLYLCVITYFVMKWPCHFIYFILFPLICLFIYLFYFPCHCHHYSLYHNINLLHMTNFLLLMKHLLYIILSQYKFNFIYFLYIYPSHTHCIYIT